MGTSYSITLHSEMDSNDLFVKASDILNVINQEMSTYIDDSLISQVNRSEIGEWTVVSKDFIDILSYATKLCFESDGIYDVSIGKLVNLWGFGPGEVKNTPSENQLKYLTSQVGCDSVELDTLSSTVRRMKDIELDFSSIAKGFAIDKVYEFLIDQKHLNSFFIELGGEIRSTKYKSNLKSWKTGVINPLEPERLIYTFLSSDYESFAMATSGDYRNVRILDGQKLSHTINPSTGIPSNYSKKSVSVISESGMIADALATTLNAMSVNKALSFANMNGIMALFIIQLNGSPKLLFSDSLQKVKI